MTWIIPLSVWPPPLLKAYKEVNPKTPQKYRVSQHPLRSLRRPHTTPKFRTMQDAQPTDKDAPRDNQQQQDPLSRVSLAITYVERQSDHVWVTERDITFRITTHDPRRQLYDKPHWLETDSSTMAAD